MVYKCALQCLTLLPISAYFGCQGQQKNICMSNRYALYFQKQICAFSTNCWHKTGCKQLFGMSLYAIGLLLTTVSLHWNLNPYQYDDVPVHNASSSMKRLEWKNSRKTMKAIHKSLESTALWKMLFKLNIYGK